MIARQIYSEKSKAAVYRNYLSTLLLYILPPLYSTKTATHLLPTTSSILDSIFRLHLDLPTNGLALGIGMHAQAVLGIGRVLQLGGVILKLFGTRR